MRIYFLGDIHGNNYALEACLKHLDTLQVDAVYCLGDLVGWLPFGDRTLTRMRSLDFPTVAGNHDLLVAGRFTDFPHQLDRMQATAYNSGLLSTIPGAIDYLAGFPLILERDDFTVIHHSPFHLPAHGGKPSIEHFHYLDEAALRECLGTWKAFPFRLIFSGHDHIPAVYELPETTAHLRFEDVHVHLPPADGPLTIHLNPRSRYWIKAGSVGGPYRDGIPLANTVLYDTDRKTVTLYRIPYPQARLYEELASHHFCGNLPTIRRFMDLLNREL
ncbi:metallophosphoesterase family protein [Desulforhabdus amnigena]|jgi:predicted phosphodiesterase|uniref:Phosphoesterase n=1 Tax=Desulforhabdus amnigena TaxID=40218 RepID=A0A9W6CWN5_9BACT|nr:metallophosphoesterase [Desulforhabdus amnigena]NLJ26683.1 metallophosphoesterase [Deltaproteobacteria bacterium]GLI33944.1 phosphoesterase [Desulforhabdus amnigena]